MPPTDDTSGESFRGLVLQLRGRTGLTQRELAKQAGCATSTIRFVEENWTGYSPDLAGRIARALGVESLDQIA